jgi:hypothetical protein
LIENPQVTAEIHQKILGAGAVGVAVAAAEEGEA